MSDQISAVKVMQFPEVVNSKHERLFLEDMKQLMYLKHTRIVLDFSKVREMNKYATLLLLSCLEEAMKHNGDIKIASTPDEVLDILKTTGVSRLFETFQTNDDALKSFRNPVL